MSMLRWDPWGALASLQRDVDDLMTRPDGRAGGRLGAVPAMDARRTDDGVVVELDVPGLGPGDVEVTVQDGVLIISGERGSPVGDDAEWLLRERPLGAFERRISLGDGIDPDAITAETADGVLTISIPNPPEERPRRIEVTSRGQRAQIDA